jgi:hypothetical protein
VKYEMGYWQIKKKKKVKEEFSKEVTANVQNTRLEATEALNETRNKIKKNE